MSDTCSTFRVKWDNEDGFAVIDAASFDKEKHTLFDAKAKTPKAPIVDDVVETPDGVQVFIPDDWEDMHWTKQEKLALELVGGEGSLVTSEGQSRADKAKAIIQDVVAERA